jgi:hypothetical protein
LPIAVRTGCPSTRGAYVSSPPKSQNSPNVDAPQTELDCEGVLIDRFQETMTQLVMDFKRGADDRVGLRITL